MLATTLLCLVVGISDGDTISARCPTLDTAHPYQQIKVRVQGIDAPERKQPFGNRARDALSKITYMKETELRCNKIDQYQRHLCSVWVAPTSAPNGPKTLDAGLAMVSVGMAWWYRAYAQEQTPEERGQYEFAEQQAKVREMGLWRDANPIAPWNWRREMN